MNPLLNRLQPYPFARLRALHAGIAPNPERRPINLSIGEPKHPTPPFIVEALARGGSKGLANYPMTRGTPALREAIAAWIVHRHHLHRLDAETEVLPVLGSREALFAFAQTVADASRPGACVAVPNPFYQIYEGAAVLAGVDTYLVNADPGARFRHRWSEVADSVWRRTQLVYVCSPDNPTGNVLTEDDWRALFELSDRHDFVIASDECYSEIYCDEMHPPLGALAAANALGRHEYPRLVVFGSLSKRSSVPGLRSGFVAGDRHLIDTFAQYRTYHGSAMSGAVAEASIAAWGDEEHVIANRALYAAKFAAVTAPLAKALTCAMPDAGFYLWAATPEDDTSFARRLLAEENVVVLPGSYLGRDAGRINPGAGRIRIALVPSLDDCVEGIERIVMCANRSK